MFRFQPEYVSPVNKTIQYNNKNIAYHIGGSGPALVLLHGFLESKAIWDDFSHELQQDFTVLAVDLPGHGESEVLAEAHSMQLMADCVKNVMLLEKLENAVVAGHSMGGYVALQLAAENENMLKGLVLFHSHAGADSQQVRENRLRTIEIVKKNRVGFITQFIPDLFDPRYVDRHAAAIRKLQDKASTMSAEAIIAALSGMRERNDQHAFLSETKMPVLFIIGKQDSRMPFTQLLSQTALPAHSETLLLDHVGHMGYLEAAGITLAALRHFSLRCYAS